MIKPLIRKNRTNVNDLLVDETIFSLANGYLGIRGSFCEGYGLDIDYNQTYVNGLYDFYDYHYEENLPGFPQEGQRFVNVIDGQKIYIYIGDTKLDMVNYDVVDLNRRYELDKGITIREVHYQEKTKKYDIYLTETRFVSREYRDVYAIRLELESPNYTGDITVKSFLEVASRNKKYSKDPRIGYTSSNVLVTDIDLSKMLIKSVTRKSNFMMMSSMIHDLAMNNIKLQSGIIAQHKTQLDKKFELTKYVIHTSNLYDSDYEQKGKELRTQIKDLNWDKLLQSQEMYYRDFWLQNRIVCDNEFFESHINYNVFQLNNSGGEDFRHNISAKGLSGEGYEGHYFWDTEVYMLPYFIFTNPQKAKNLLMFRYHTLQQAKVEAMNLSYDKGVKIPWRTINGNEVSPYYPAGSAQIHINSDIAYACMKYYEATNDLDFMIDYGFEIMVETARFIVENANYKNGFYHINSVTGPDEYTTVVDDNYYTNVMFQYHLENILSLYKEHRDKLNKIYQQLNLSEDEMDMFAQIMNNIYLPYDEKLKVYLQDINFKNKKRLLVKDIPKDKRPLLLHYHPLYIYRHQVLKQADTLLAMMLLEYNDYDVLSNTYDYYEPITTHDSSLSKCIYSINAFHLGKNEEGYAYFEDVLKTDYDNIQENTEHGLHVANLGGSYLSLIYGLLGIRAHKDYLMIAPLKCMKMNYLELNIKYQGVNIKVIINEKVKVFTDNEVLIRIYDQILKVRGELITAIK
jgi:alpha,alpha-trehalose phosphorylase